MSIEIAQRQAELEELNLRRSAIQSELDALEKEQAGVPVMRRTAFDKLTPREQSAYCADVTAGKARLID